MSNLLNKITDKLSGDHHQHKEEKEQQQQRHQEQQQRSSQAMPQRSPQGTSVQSDDYNTGYTSAKTESAYNPMMESQGQNQPSDQQWASGGTTMGSKMTGYHDDTHADEDDFGEYSSNRQQQQSGWGSSGQTKSRPGMVHESREDALENQRGPFPEDEENEDDDGDQYGRHDYMQSRQGQRQQNMGQRMQRGAQRGSNYMSDDM